MANLFLPRDSHNVVSNVGAEEKTEDPPMAERPNQSSHTMNDAFKIEQRLNPDSFNYLLLYNFSKQPFDLS